VLPLCLKTHTHAHQQLPAATLECVTTAHTHQLAPAWWPLQVPGQIFITQQLPKGPTGKIQRRFMAQAFCKPGAAKGSGGVARQPTSAAAGPSGSACADGSATSSGGLLQLRRQATSSLDAVAGSGAAASGALKTDGYWLLATSLRRAGIK
jgi:hypothetical protein